VRPRPWYAQVVRPAHSTCIPAKSTCPSLSVHACLLSFLLALTRSPLRPISSLLSLSSLFSLSSLSSYPPRLPGPRRVRRIHFHAQCRPAAMQGTQTVDSPIAILLLIDSMDFPPSLSTHPVLSCRTVIVTQIPATPATPATNFFSHKPAARPARAHFIQSPSFGVTRSRCLKTAFPKESKQTHSSSALHQIQMSHVTPQRKQCICMYIHQFINSPIHQFTNSPIHQFTITKSHHTPSSTPTSRSSPTVYTTGLVSNPLNWLAAHTVYAPIFRNPSQSPTSSPAGNLTTAHTQSIESHVGPHTLLLTIAPPSTHSFCTSTSTLPTVRQ
jgi:hypothetical protein